MIPLSIGLVVACGFALVDLTRKSHTKSLFAAIGQASESLHDRPATIESAEAYVSDLKKVDLRFVDQRVKESFLTYLAAFEATQTFFRVSAKVDPRLEEECAAAHRRLQLAAEEYYEN